MRPLLWPALLLLASCGGPEPNLKSQDPYERYLGTRELMERSDAVTMAEIVLLLEDPHFLVVTGAIEFLAHRGRPEFLQHIAPKLKHKHPLVRQTACAALGTIRNPEGIPLLIETLKDPETSVRRSALKALAKYLDDKTAQTAVIDCVEDKDPSVSYMAARLLYEKSGKNGIERSRKAWTEALQ